MSTLINIDGNPDDVRGTGAQLKAMAEDLGAQAASIASEIETKESGQPWGNDHFGNSFKTQQNGYLSVPEGADKPFNEILKHELNNAGEGLGRIGDGTMGAMNDYQLTDGVNGQQINKVGEH
jgi:hypothetical protein